MHKFGKLNLGLFSSDYDADSNCDVRQTISNHCHYVSFRQIVALYSYHIVKCRRNQFRANARHAQVSQCSFKVLHFMVCVLWILNRSKHDQSTTMKIKETVWQTCKIRGLKYHASTYLRSYNIQTRRYSKTTVYHTCVYFIHVPIYVYLPECLLYLWSPTWIYLCNQKIKVSTRFL